VCESESLLTGNETRKKHLKLWHALTIEESIKALDSQFKGLLQKEAEARLQVYGPNVLPKSKRLGLFRAYLRQFKSPLMYMLLIAAGISFGIQQFSDGLFIVCVLQLNSIIGAVQEWKSDLQAEELDEALLSFVTVFREGIKKRIIASELVPGDIVFLESGDYVPVDARLLEACELLVDESTLTGESVPIRKSSHEIFPKDAFLTERKNMLFAGSVMLSGRAKALVAGTGLYTEIGAIASALARESETETPLLIKMRQFTKRIGFFTLLAITVIGAIQILQGNDIKDVFLIAVALAVSIIPEGLPVALTVALSVARHRMGKHNVIVRTLSAIEGLGATTFIASDKTGTLTCNKLTVKLIYIPEHGLFEIGGEGYKVNGCAQKEGGPVSEESLGILQKLAITGALCNEGVFKETSSGYSYFGDTVDVSLLVLASKLGLNKETLHSYFPEIFLVPYEPSRKFSASYNKDGGGVSVHVKGAAEIILSMCENANKKDLREQSEVLAKKGYRVIALATGHIKDVDIEKSHLSIEGTIEKLQDLECLGFVGIIDPVREDSIDAIESCKKAGIQVAMITGDHPATALTIARKLGMATTAEEVITGKDLTKFEADPLEMARLLREKKVFSRVLPMQKLIIVDALKKLGHFVTVTGDGVNDAPALHEANIGISMGKEGTDVARKASDIILIDDKFSSIVSGIFEGRAAYDNTRKVIFLLLSTGFAEIILFFATSLFNLPIPLFAAQLLWLNLVTNGIQDIALAFEKSDKSLLNKQPRAPQEPIFNRLMIEQTVTSGGFMGCIAFFLFWIVLKLGWSESDARNILFLLMVVFENLHALNSRSEEKRLLSLNFFSNPFLIVSIIIAHGVHIIAMYTPVLRDVLKLQPISLMDWLMTLIIGVGVIVVAESYKYFRVPSLTDTLKK